MAIAMHSCASFEIEPYDIAPVLNLFTIDSILSTSSIDIAFLFEKSKSKSCLIVYGLSCWFSCFEYNLNNS